MRNNAANSSEETDPHTAFCLVAHGRARAVPGRVQCHIYSVDNATNAGPVEVFPNSAGALRAGKRGGPFALVFVFRAHVRRMHAFPSTFIKAVLTNHGVLLQYRCFLSFNHDVIVVLCIKALCKPFSGRYILKNVII